MGCNLLRGHNMKKTLFAILFVIFQSTSFAATQKYQCYSAGKNKADGYFNSTSQYAELTVSPKYAKMEVFGTDGAKGDSYVYDLAGAASGKSQVAGYLQGNMNISKSVYRGDGIQTIYLEPVLKTGGKVLKSGKSGGLLAFSGYGYSWDWNLCVHY